MNVQEFIPSYRLLNAAMALSPLIGPAALEESIAELKGQPIIRLDFSTAPTFFALAEPPAMGAPYVFLHVIHDTPLKPLPGLAKTPNHTIQDPSP